jgi:hypothetical protein
MIVNKTGATKLASRRSSFLRPEVHPALDTVFGWARQETARG